MRVMKSFLLQEVGKGPWCYGRSIARGAWCQLELSLVQLDREIGIFCIRNLRATTSWKEVVSVTMQKRRITRICLCLSQSPGDLHVCNVPRFRPADHFDVAANDDDDDDE